MKFFQWLQDAATEAFFKFIVKLSEIGTPEPYQNFLIDVLRTIAESKGNPELVYPLLRANLDKLNLRCIMALWGWATPRLEQAGAETADMIAALVTVFGDLILDFPEGNQADRIEIAIAAYNLACEVYARQSATEKAAILRLRLAHAYHWRAYGQAPENQNISRELVSLSVQDVMHHPSVALEESIFPVVSDPEVNLLHHIFREMLSGVFQTLLEAANFEPASVYFVNSSLKLSNTITQRLKQPIYPLLEANLDRLNDHFAEVLHRWSISNPPAVEQLGSPVVAVMLGGLSELLIFFPKGDRASNLEIAIAGYKAALELFPDKTAPMVKIGFTICLGMAYANRIRGDEPENIELAISYFKQALDACRVLEKSVEFPQQEFLGAIYKELAAAYRKRIYDEPATNLKQAIHYYKQALGVITPEVSLKDWAGIQQGLGNVYSTLYWLNLNQQNHNAESDENFPEAIRCYEAVLQSLSPREFPQEWSMAQKGVGGLYLDVTGRKLQEYRKQAAKCYRRVLRVVKREEYPYDWALTQYHLGLAYRDQNKLDQAVQCFQRSLEIFHPTAYPWGCLRAGRNLGNIALLLGQPEKAISGYAVAIEALEQRWVWTLTESRRQFLLSASIDLYANVIQTCIHLQRFEQALEYVERSKARNLVELLYDRTQYPKSASQEICNQLDDLRQQLTVEQKRLLLEANRYDLNNSVEGDSPQPGSDVPRGYLPDHTHLNQLQQTLDDFIKETIQPIDPSFSLTEKVEPINFLQIQQLLPNQQTALLEWYVIGRTFFTFIVTPESSTPIVWQSTSQDLENLRIWVNNYLNTYRDDQQRWRSSLGDQLQQLSSILHIDQLLSLLPSNCHQLILIPHLYLHLLPLHALPLRNGLCLLDRFPQGIHYAPSCQLLQLTQHQQRSNFQSLFAIQDPETNDPLYPPLLYADLEVELIRSFFTSSKVLAKENATESDVCKNSDLQVAHCCHFSCHGQFNPQLPLESALLLADQDRFTLGEIFELNLNQCRIVTLSACETGMTDPNSISDEYIGLPSAFLYAGSASVVSSLWEVNDLSTTFLMLKFYENLSQFPQTQPGSAAIALNQAQKWLRELTCDDVEHILEMRQAQVEKVFSQWRPGQRLIFQESLKQIRRRSPFPFIKPFYWAAFTATGF
jgi:CHAT domain-containing protein